MDNFSHKISSSALSKRLVAVGDCRIVLPYYRRYAASRGGGLTHHFYHTTAAMRLFSRVTAVVW